MSNRFHSKWHRSNHHTNISGTNADAGHDPIASPDNPFQGDFVLSGSLSATQNLKINGYGLISTNNNNNNPALLVQQYGSGPSFRVDDIVNDTNPFIIDTAGNVGVGTTTPQYSLDVNNTGRIPNLIVNHFIPTNPSNAGYSFGGNPAYEANMFSITNDDNIKGTQVSIFGLSGAYLDFTQPQTIDFDLRIGSFNKNNNFSGWQGSQGGFIEAQNQYPFVMITNGTPTMVLSAGLVGIGVINPLTKLHIGGGSVTLDPALGIQSSANNSNTYIAGGNQWYYGGEIHLEGPNGLGGGILRFNTGTAASGGRNTEAMRIDKDGKVGINTTTPNADLTISGTLSGKGPFYYGNGNGRIGFSTVDFTMGNPDRGSSINNRALVADVGNTLTINYNSDFTGGTCIHDSTGTKGTIFTSSGKVGIGTFTPNTTLTVNGSFSATGASTLTVNNDTSPALLIQQYGKGLAFRVDDTVNDKSPFVIDLSGNVGIGTTNTYNAALTIVGTVSAGIDPNTGYGGSFINGSNYYLPTDSSVFITNTRSPFFNTTYKLAPNTTYEIEYGLFSLIGTSATVINYALSSNVNFSYGAANFIQDTGDINPASIGTAINTGGSNIIDIGNTESINANKNSFGVVRALVITGTNTSTLTMTICCNNTNGIKPLRGSYRKITQFS